MSVLFSLTPLATYARTSSTTPSMVTSCMSGAYSSRLAYRCRIWCTYRRVYMGMSILMLKSIYTSISYVRAISSNKVHKYMYSLVQYSVYMAGIPREPRGRSKAEAQAHCRRCQAGYRNHEVRLDQPYISASCMYIWYKI